MNKHLAERLRMTMLLGLAEDAVALHVNTWAQEHARQFQEGSQAFFQAMDRISKEFPFTHLYDTLARWDRTLHKSLDTARDVALPALEKADAEGKTTDEMSAPAFDALSVRKVRQQQKLKQNGSEKQQQDENALLRAMTQETRQLDQQERQRDRTGKRLTAELERAEKKVARVSAANVSKKKAAAGTKRKRESARPKKKLKKTAGK